MKPKLFSVSSRGCGYDAYSFSVIPRMGEVSSDQASYQYLVESIRKFPNQVQLGLVSSMMQVQWKSGVCSRASWSMLSLFCLHIEVGNDLGV